MELYSDLFQSYITQVLRKLKSIFYLFVLLQIVLLDSTENFCSHAIKALFFLVFWTKQIQNRFSVHCSIHLEVYFLG